MICKDFVICWPMGLSIALWVEVCADLDGAGTIISVLLRLMNVLSDLTQIRELIYKVKESKLNWNT